jgi:AcrR family transcriptional regulator
MRAIARFSAAKNRVVARISQLAPRRQARGEKRIEEILDAAMRVIAKVGYSRATTNAIAAEAGISPGSLYQYFDNKEQIAQALEKRYAHLLDSTTHAALHTRPGQPLEIRVGKLVDAIVTFACETPGFQALFSERPYSAGVAHVAHSHHQSIVAELDKIVADQAPQLSKADRSLITQVATQIARALMPSVVAAEGPARARMVRELKTALTSYIEARTAPS